MAPLIRYYCLVLPSDSPQMGYDYLIALEQTGYGVRACPIGAMFMAGPWPKVMHLFAGEMPAPGYVNVVCAPLGLSLGYAMTKQAAAEVRTQGGVRKMPGVDAAGNDEIVYRPQTAVTGLYTVGVKNVIITRPPPPSQSKPKDEELQYLRKYDLVLCPTTEDVDAFLHYNIDAIHVPPRSAVLQKLLAPLVTER